MAKERISAVIVKEKRILLVTGFDEKRYWTPGGKLEPGESHEQTLKRELKEELGVELTDVRPYFSYEGFTTRLNEPQKVHCYLVEFKGDIRPSSEITSFGWFSRADFDSKRVRMFDEAEKNFIPRVIKDGILG
jgi:8-oxo-dGTP pyrophosphatase MutT (NUDIX family)